VSTSPSVERGDGSVRYLELQIIAVVVVIGGGLFLGLLSLVASGGRGALPSRRLCCLSSLVFLYRSAKFLTVRQSARLCR
jgi:L-asparagine transporter-like permease